MYDLAHTAIHEAGHAVAFCRLFPGSSPLEISIEPDIEDASLGHHAALDRLSAVSFDTPVADAETWFRRHAIYCCAGFAAAVIAGYSEAEASVGCTGDFESAGHRLAYGKRMAADLLNRPENRRAVRVVAEALLRWGHIDGDHLAVLLDLDDSETAAREYQTYLNLIGLSRKP